MGFYSPIKKNKIVLLSGEWTELKMLCYAKQARPRNSERQTCFTDKNLDLKMCAVETSLWGTLVVQG